MNLVILLLLSLVSFGVVWGGQTLLLYLDGAENPRRGMFRIKDASSFVRIAIAVLVQVVLVGIVLGYPLLLGQDPLDYHKTKILPVQTERFFELLLVTLLCFVVGVGGEMLMGWVQLAPRYGPLKSTRKVVEAVIRPIPLACLEEGIFRGIVLEQLMLALRPGPIETVSAIVGSAAVFSSLHFIRPAKTYGPALGLFVLGCLLGTAYIVGGHTYWLPVGVHAGGVLAIKLLQPFVEYRGPSWVIGDRTYPIAGVVGIGAMLLIGLYILARFGTP